MSEKQKTVSKPVVLKGKGLHTGIDVQMTLLPAPENHGIIFQRVDIQDKPRIHANVDNVTDTSRGTTLVEGGHKVCTVEHTLASITGLGIDNVLIEINGPEAPIMDGSSKLIVEAIKEAGITELQEDKNFYIIKEKITYKDESKGIEITAYPDDHLNFDVMINFNSRVLHNQYAILEGLSDFEKEISPCRTFVFLHELEFLASNNLIKGGDLDNAIVIIDRDIDQTELDRLADLFNKPRVKVHPNGILNNIDLRFTNEPARHKLLDLVGDLTLIGQPIKGRIIATRPGHHANTEFAKIIRSMIKKDQTKVTAPFYDPNKPPLFDVNQIKKKLPHRPPFLLVDKIIHMDSTSVVGIKNVTMNEGFFIGHFPDEPVMPGVLQVEATAQTGGILVLSTVPDPENYTTYFLKMDNVRFKKKVVPGDTLIIKAELTQPIKRGIAVMFGQAFVGNSVVMEGEFMAQIVKTK